MNPTSPQPSAPRRSRIRWIPLVFGVIAPLVELATIIAVGQRLGGGRTFALLLSGVVLGVLVISSQGRKARAHLQASLAAQTGDPRGDLSAAAPREVKGRGWLVVAGLLFIAPGFASDVVALLLFIPPVRTLLTAGLVAMGVKWFQTVGDALVPPGSSRRPGDVVPGQVVDPQGPVPPDSRTRREVQDPGVIEGRIVED